MEKIFHVFFPIQKTGSNCQISNLKFVNGMSGHGGAMIVLGKNVVIKDSVFENNYADYAGAAIYVCPFLMIVVNIRKKVKI